MESLLYSEKEEGELTGLKYQLTCFFFFPDKDKGNCISSGHGARILERKLKGQRAHGGQGWLHWRHLHHLLKQFFQQ